MSSSPSSKKRIAIFASGSGTNAEAFFRYFAESDLAEVALLVSNKPEAYALKRAEKFHVPTEVASNAQLSDAGFALKLLEKYKIDFVVLAGYLRLIPAELARSFEGRIVNIHPALLPKYGGKGMYGSKVHEAVVAAAEAESGITIHFVNELYDEGDIVFQARCPLSAEDTPESLAQKIHQLEHQHYPAQVAQLIKQLS